MLKQILALDIDIAESIVSADGDWSGTLVEFIENNSDFSPLDVLTLTTALFATGTAKIAQGNGDFCTVKLVRASQVTERGIGLPEYAI